MTRRRRGLSPEDLALWEHVTAGIEPLRRRRKPSHKEDAALPPEPASPPVAASPVEPSQPQAKPKSPAPALPPLAPIARQERRRLAGGTLRIEGRIDLHGMRQAEAHGALLGFLGRAQGQGHSVVLVITGKGRAAQQPSSPQEERGVLRRLVPQWLRLPDLRSVVLGFEEAHHRHGGGGALYVRLRRSRRGAGP